MKKGALIDPTGLYRYSLWREWDANAPKITFIMLNPSRADATVDDPTIRRCINFASSWSYGFLEVVNLFAYRTSDPKKLHLVEDPVGQDNDRYIQRAVSEAKVVVLAWGHNDSIFYREALYTDKLFAKGYNNSIFYKVALHSS
ncbi:MAG: DUF1643 domain-containing protein [Prochloraceae cyanobacterium]|nr:DUF1643 domain-containing protein [Prochloraceae cyanobacterium]